MSVFRSASNGGRLFTTGLTRIARGFVDVDESVRITLQLPGLMGYRVSPEVLSGRSPVICQRVRRSVGSGASGGAGSGDTTLVICRRVWSSSPTQSVDQRSRVTAAQHLVQQ